MVKLFSFKKDFLHLNVYGRTASSQLDMNSLVTVKEPASYGASVSWSHKGWYLEAGTENPFTKHVRYKEHADYGVYKYSQVRTSRINQQTGYVKVAYTFEFWSQDFTRQKRCRPHHQLGYHES